MATRTFGLRARASAPKTLEIDVFDVIGETWFGDGFSAKSLDARLKAAGEVDTIRLRINSLGGDVWEGFAIYEMLRAHPARVEAEIEGIAASMATVVAMAADRVSMAANADFMVHEPWTIVMGGADDLAHEAEHIEQAAANIASTYAARTGATPEQAREWMRAETWMTAEQAQERGFVDEILPRKERAAAALTAEQAEAYRAARPEARALMVAPAPPSPDATTVAAVAAQEKPTMKLEELLTALGAKDAEEAIANAAKSRSLIQAAEGAVTIAAAVCEATGKTGPAAAATVAAWREKSDRCDAAEARVQELEGERARATAKDAIDAAEREGRLPPATRQRAESMFSKFGIDGLTEFLGALSPVVVPASADHREPATAEPVATLTAEERAVARATGMSDEDMLAARKTWESREASPDSNDSEEGA
jgi:ATP-dependent Clp endopeptidase proteolytic subunit ClpP